MKKSNNRPADRRKKTAADTRADNQRAERRRDAQRAAAKNPWPNLEKLYQLNLQLLQTAIPTAEILKNREILEHVVDLGELKKLAQIFKNDVETFKNSLFQIHAKHANETTGSIEDPDVLMKSLVIDQEYVSWNEGYQSVLLPVQMQITEIINDARVKAETAIHQEQSQSSTQEGVSQ